jgi:type II secretory pathway component PulF
MNTGQIEINLVLVLLMTVALILAMIPAAGVIYGLYWLLTLPMRRSERARFFLDLLEMGLNEGRSPERAIIDAASSADGALGRRFYRLADDLKVGIKLSDALERAPNVVPLQVAAMLAAGERIGDLGKVLPACRKLLNDGTSQVRGALNYMAILTVLVPPFMIGIPIAINVIILPRFRAVFSEVLEGQSLPPFTRMVFEHSTLPVVILAIAYVLFWIATITYIGGPVLHGGLRSVWPGMVDRILYRLPWRRKRLQRDFSSMLAVLLDSEVPEVEAVSLAAESTANTVVRRRAAKVCALLDSGVKLPLAIRALDDSGELQWRLTNALQRGRGFLRALKGWHESLDAKAFQLEQASAQTATSVVVLLNGLLVAAVVIAMFLALIAILNGALLW